MVNERRRGSGPVFVSGATKAASLLSGGRPREPEKSSYTRRKPCGLVFGQEFDSPRLHHVGASFISLAPTFLQKSERAHAAAPPFRIEPAVLGSRLRDEAMGRKRHIACDEFFILRIKTHPGSFCCSSLPNRICSSGCYTTEKAITPPALFGGTYQP